MKALYHRAEWKNTFPDPKFLELGWCEHVDLLVVVEAKPTFTTLLRNSIPLVELVSPKHGQFHGPCVLARSSAKHDGAIGKFVTRVRLGEIRYWVVYLDKFLPRDEKNAAVSLLVADLKAKRGAQVVLGDFGMSVDLSGFERVPTGKTGGVWHRRVALTTEGFDLPMSDERALLFQAA